MKKSRLLSLLLAVIMIVSSLPIVATSVSAAETNLLANAAVTSSVTNFNSTDWKNYFHGLRDRTESTTTGYLHLGSRTAAAYGLGYNFSTKFTAGTTYVLAFDMRTAVAFNGNNTNTWPGGIMQIRPGGNVTKTTDAGKNDSQYWNITTVQSNWANLIMSSNDYTAFGSMHYQGNGNIAEWRHYELTLPNVTTTVENAYISFFGVDSHAAPFDIDNIKLYSGSVADANLLEECNFEGTAPTIITSGATTTKGAFFVSNGIERPSVATAGAVIEWISTPKAYKEVTLTNQNNGDISAPIVITYTPSNVTVPAGIYELTGQFRDGWHTNNTTTINNNMKVTPTIALGSGNVKLGEATVTTEWTDVTYRFAVAANTTLTKVTFSSNLKETVQFRDISLVKVGEVEIVNDAIESGILTGATKNYTTVVDSEYDINDIGSNGKAVKNGYITVGERDWYWNNSSEGYVSKFRIFDIKLEEDFEAGYTYYLKFDARHNVPTNDKQNLQLRINNNDKLWKTLADGTDGWNRNIQAALDVTASGGDVNVYVRRTHYERNIPVDIDNVVIWREPSATKNGTFGPEDAANVLYNENFNNPDVNYIAASGTYGKIANVDNIPMFHNFDENYGKVNSGACALEYSNLNIDSGVYTLSADLRVPYYHFASISKKTYAAAQAPAEQIKLEQNDTAGMAAFKALNKHTAKFEFTLTPIAGGQNVTKTVEQEMGFLWSNVSALVIIEEGYKLTGVKITPVFSEKVPAANKALDFKNVSLVRHGGFADQNTAIETGLLASATHNYNTVEAEYDFNDYTSNNGVVAKNGYISAGDLPWYYDGSNWVTAANVLFKQDVSEKYTEGKQYVVTFRARKAATTAGAVKITASFWGQGAGTTLTLTDEWQEYKGSKVATADMNNNGLNFSIHLADGSYAPVDIDDLTIWKDNNGNKIYDSGDVLLYSENYNNPSKKYIGTSWNVNEIDAVFLGKVNSAYPNANNSVGAVGISDRRHTNITHEFEETYASGALEYTGLNVASGVFSFTADIKLPYHYHYNMNSLTSSDKAAAETYYNLNYHEANLVFTMKKGSETKTETVSLGKKALSSSWNTVSAYVILEDGYTVTGIKVVPVISKLNNAEVVPAANQVLNFKNVGLVRRGGLSVKNDPIETGLLANATKNYTETVDSGYDLYNYDANNYAEKNGYIAVDRLPWYFRTESATSNGKTSTAGWASNTIYFTMTLDEKIVADTAYGVKIDARRSTPSAESTQMKFRLLNGGGTIDVGPNGNTKTYFVADNDFDTFATSYTPAAGSAIGKNFVVSIRRGPGPMNAPVDFDNLTVWVDSDKDCVQDANERVIYSENFNDADGGYIGTANNKFNTKLDRAMDLGTAKISHRFEETYAKVSGADCAVAYTNLDLNPGVYTFSAKLQVPYHYYTEIRNEGDYGPAGRVWSKGDGNGEKIFAANEHNVEIKFTLTPDDASAPVKYKTASTVVTNAWDDVAASVVIDEGYKLTGITVTPTFTDLAKNAWGANNVALNFKKVNLVRLGGYVPFNGTITNGELLTGADYNYTDVETGYDFNTDNFEDGKAVKNGYISVGPMPWVYNGTKWVANDILLFKQNSPLLYTVGNRYAVSFSARKGVDTDETVKLQARFYGKNTGLPEITLTNEWQNYVGIWTNDQSGSAGQHINFSININGGKAVDTPVDLDNLVIWEDLNGNMICDLGEKIAYSENYNTDGDYVGLSTVNSYICSKFYDKIGGSWPTEANSVGASIIVKNERYYDNFTHLYEDNYAYGDLEYANIKNAGEGVYTFTAEVELPYHYHYDMTSLTSSDKAIAQKYYDLNAHDIKVMFTLNDGTSDVVKTTTLNNAVEYGWNYIAASVVVGEGYTLKAVKAELVSAKFDDGTDVVPADKQVLNFRNVWLTSEELPVVEAEADDDENYLDGIKPQYNDNTIPKEVVENDPDGYLYVGERNDSAAENYEIFRINTGAKLKAGTTYYVEYDLKCALATRIRVTVDVSTESETVLDGSGASKTSPSTFIVSDSNSGFKTVYFMNTSGTEWLHSDVPAGTDYTFKGHFTPTADSNGLVIKFNRGDYAPSCKGALELDNFRVYYIENGKQIDVYTNNLNKEGDIADFVGNAYAGTGFEFKQILPVSHTLYTPVDADEVMSVTYNLGLSVDESVEGKYSFMTVVKLAEATDKKARARVYFNYSDGTFDVDYLEITNDWGYIGKSGWLERYPELESITIEFNSDVPVMLMKPELNIFYKYTYGKPNSGIVMVLIKKMQGKMIDPWKSVGVN